MTCAPDSAFFDCAVCGCVHEKCFTHCRSCQALVYKTDVPTKRSGCCWRCEVKRLNDRLAELEQRLRAKQGELFCG
jgi:hypothetical protein